MENYIEDVPSAGSRLHATKYIVLHERYLMLDCSAVNLDIKSSPYDLYGPCVGGNFCPRNPFPAQPYFAQPDASQERALFHRLIQYGPYLLHVVTL